MAEINKVTVTLDDGNHNITTTLELNGEEVKLIVKPDESMPANYRSPMVTIHEVFIASLLNQ